MAEPVCKLCKRPASVIDGGLSNKHRSALAFSVHETGLKCHHGLGAQRGPEFLVCIQCCDSVYAFTKEQTDYIGRNNG